MILTIKKNLKQFLNRFGYDIIQSAHDPKNTLLGLTSYDIKTILDIGANEGQFARYILKFFPSAQLFCFEPLPHPYKKLENWAAKRPHSKIQTFNIGIGERSEKRSIFYHLDHSPSSSLLPATKKLVKIEKKSFRQERIDVKIETLDGVFADIKKTIQDDILIKLDVQGYEDRVLKGGKLLFERAKAAIVEVNTEQLYKGQAKFEDLLFLLTSYGFHYGGNLEQHYEKSGKLLFFDAVFFK